MSRTLGTFEGFGDFRRHHTLSFTSTAFILSSPSLLLYVIQMLTKSSVYSLFERPLRKGSEQNKLFSSMGKM